MHVFVPLREDNAVSAQRESCGVAALGAGSQRVYLHGGGYWSHRSGPIFEHHHFHPRAFGCCGLGVVGADVSPQSGCEPWYDRHGRPCSVGGEFKPPSSIAVGALPSLLQRVWYRCMVSSAYFTAGPFAWSSQAGDAHSGQEVVSVCIYCGILLCAPGPCLGHIRSGSWRALSVVRRYGPETLLVSLCRSCRRLRICTCVRSFLYCLLLSQAMSPAVQ
mmetsp:Transcript_7157/g.44437  ORF Transcript_7157/g.44437 Transcript_7157/m.44437 type:complete len:218 (-) Transcript_7157:1066-1719(-)